MIVAVHPVHGEQEGASFNGHFGSTCHHPLFVFNQFGDCEGTMLRAGNVHSAHRWRDVLDPILSRYGAAAKPHLKDGAIYRPRLPTMQVANRALAPNASSVVPGHSPLGVLLHRCNLGSKRHGWASFSTAVTLAVKGMV